MAATIGQNSQDRVNIGKQTTSGRVRKVTDAGQRIRMASLNIRSGRASGLEAGIQALQQGNVDVDFLQKTKLMQGIHTRHVDGYDTWAREEESRHQGGVAVV